MEFRPAWPSENSRHDRLDVGPAHPHDASWSGSWGGGDRGDHIVQNPHRIFSPSAREQREEDHFGIDVAMIAQIITLVATVATAVLMILARPAVRHTTLTTAWGWTVVAVASWCVAAIG